MNDCIFCKIVKDDVPCNKVYEDKDFLAFLDISPCSKGHTLIIPKKHFETILDTNDEILKDFIILIKKISKVIYEGLKCEGFNIIMNQFKASGQIVPHLHAHIIPRFSDDGLRAWPHKKYDSEDEEKEIQERITRLLK